MRPESINHLFAEAPLFGGKIFYGKIVYFSIRDCGGVKRSLSQAQCKNKNTIEIKFRQISSTDKSESESEEQAKCSRLFSIFFFLLQLAPSPI